MIIDGCTIEVNFIRFYISGDIAPPRIHHHIYSPRNHSNHTYRHHHGASLPIAQQENDSPTAPAVQMAYPLASMNETQYHHHGNATSPATVHPPSDVSALHSGVIRHHHYDNTIPQTPVGGSAATSITQVHRHHHYGNGDFTLQLKKKKAKKKEYCNISEHEDLVRLSI